MGTRSRYSGADPSKPGEAGTADGDPNDDGTAAGPGRDGREDASSARAFDPVEHYFDARRQQRSLRSFVGVARRAAGMARRANPRLLLVSTVLQVLTAGLLAVQVLLGKLALEGIFRADTTGGPFTDVVPALVGLLAATAISGLATSAQAQVQRVLGEYVVRDTWESIFDVTVGVDLATFESPRFFDELQRVQTSALMRPLTMTQGLTQLLGGLVGIVGLGAALISLQPLLVPLLLLAGIPLTLISRRSGGAEFGFSVAQTPSARLRGYLSELLSGRDEAKEIRAFLLGPHLRGRWARNYARYLSHLAAHVKRVLLLAVLSALATTVVLTLALGLLVYLVLDDRLELAAAGAALIATRLLSSRIDATFKGATALFESALFLQDLERFIARKRERTSAHDGTGSAGDLPSLVRMDVRDLGFVYPTSSATAIEGVSFSIEAGEVIALVGENGSGKTTLAKIVGGLFQPTSGTVAWNGEAVTSQIAEDVRRRVAVIFQDFVRFAMTAGENVSLGNIDVEADPDRIRAATERAGADDFVSRLPEGYDTRLGRLFGGTDLSGGQWQRLAIARAFYRDADLLVLDEPTASLDPRAEAELFDRVRQLADGRAVMLISHRFSTVRHADQILVMHGGRVVERGRHEDLMLAGGRYAELFELQASSYR